MSIPNSRKPWLIVLTGIIAVGLLSRLVHTGFVFFDKYLGDALYAAMVYAILRLFRNTATVWAMVIMTAIELFQLTMIPAHLLGSPHLIVQVSARLIGTQFSFGDLLTYAVGIGCIRLLDTRGESQPS